MTMETSQEEFGKMCLGRMKGKMVEMGGRCLDVETKSEGTTTTYLLDVGLTTSPLASPAGYRVAALLTVTDGAPVGHGALLGRGLRILLASSSLHLTAQVGGQLAVLLRGLPKAVLENPVVPTVKEK
jgi:hypothetical protein